MTHRCTIQRDAKHATNLDEWGNDEPPVWGDAVTQTGISCRYWYDDAATIMDGEKRIMSAARYVLLPIDTDVTEDDRVSTITDRRGRVLVEGPLRIDSLGAHELDHLVAKLVTVT